MTARVRALPKRDVAGEALVHVERATHALHVELKDELARVAERQPELSVWLTTALWMLEMAAKDLRTEPDRERRRAGVAVAQMHAMRVSTGLELASAMGVLDADPEAFDLRFASILAELERARS
ncbi:hypothetical protein [Sandaracinus amylolyticus]|uniref:Uncharacterized protein n=1 Tax=Sandaracinus amylolyticus TaxID=927083 RepID=A0A0F6SDF2_9BACT|nr:hypothetical protein [Sandaracinus amylolyticus]AKF03339.1 hypothetical protein DB32_000488 [Sandaracinus amylolyticus]